MWNDIVMVADPKALARLVGLRIRELRTARGWSMSSLAARAGLGKATLSEIEAGQRNPTVETLYAIAAQLQIGLSELLTERGSSPAAAPVVRGAAVEATLVAAYRDPTVTTEIYRLADPAGHPADLARPWPRCRRAPAHHRRSRSGRPRREPGRDRRRRALDLGADGPAHLHRDRRADRRSGPDHAAPGALITPGVRPPGPPALPAPRSRTRRPRARRRPWPA